MSEPSKIVLQTLSNSYYTPPCPTTQLSRSYNGYTVQPGLEGRMAATAVTGYCLMETMEKGTVCERKIDISSKKSFLGAENLQNKIN